MQALILIFVVVGALGVVQVGGVAGVASLVVLALICVGATAFLGPSSRRGTDDTEAEAGHDAAAGVAEGAAGELAAQPATAGRSAHFTRHATTPGWIYVARNDLHAADLYKVGYTTVSPRARMDALNRQGDGVTVAVGEFRLIHARQVPKSYTAEQQVFDRLTAHRARRHREFFQAPLPTVIAAVDAVADEMASGPAGPGVLPDMPAAAAVAAPLVADTCTGCRAHRLHPASNVDGQVQLTCSHCGERWFIGVPWNDAA